MSIVKSASADGRLGMPDRFFGSSVAPSIPLLGDVSFVNTVPGPSKITLEPSPTSTGNLLDFSADAFQLDKYVVNKGETLVAAAGVKDLPSPPLLSKPGSGQAATIYYTMSSRDPDSPSGELFAGSGQSSQGKRGDDLEAYLEDLKQLSFGGSVATREKPVTGKPSQRKRGDDLEAYLEDLKLLSFGGSETAREEPLTSLEFSFNLIPDGMDDDWEDVNLLSYGWV
jgi:hypothetical protein